MVEVTQLQELNKEQLIDVIVFLEDVSSLPSVTDMMKRLEALSRKHHLDTTHPDPWKTCTTGRCIEDHRILGKIYMGQAA